MDKNASKEGGGVKVPIDEASRTGPAFGLSLLQKLASDGNPEAVKRYEKAKAEYHKNSR